MNPEAVAKFIHAIPPAFRAEDSRVSEKKAEDRRVSQVVAMYQAMSAGDVATLRDNLAEDVEMEMAGPPESPTAGRWKGRDDVLSGASRNYGRLSDQRPELLSVVAQGDAVAVIAREKGCIRATGREYEMAWMHLFTFRGDQISRIYGFCDNHALIQAATPEHP